MRAVQIQDYAGEYLNKSDSELLQPASQREHLTVEAGAALEGELARRKINALEEPAIFRKEHTQLDQLVSSPTVQLQLPTGVGQFVAKVLKLYHDHFWFFFKLTLPVVAVSWITILATNREVREMSRQLQAAGHLSFALISQMLFVRVGGYLAKLAQFLLLVWCYVRGNVGRNRISEPSRTFPVPRAFFARISSGSFNYHCSYSRCSESR